MEKYFDAFLYLANWGDRIFKLRLPSRLLPADTTQLYCDGGCFAARHKGDHVVLTYNLEVEPGDDWEEGAGQLAALVPVRAELARGDRRALYLGWLLAVQHEARSTDTPEPPVPPGLGSSAPRSTVWSNSCTSTAIWWRSPQKRANRLRWRSPEASDLAAWFATRPVGDKDKWLARLLLGGRSGPAGGVVAALSRPHRSLAGCAPAGSASPEPPVSSCVRRRCGCDERERIAAEKAAAAKARREREARCDPRPAT